MASPSETAQAQVPRCELPVRAMPFAPKIYASSVCQHAQISRRLRKLIVSHDAQADSVADAVAVLGGTFGVPSSYVFGYDVSVLRDNKGGFFKYFWCVVLRARTKTPLRCVALRGGAVSLTWLRQASRRQRRDCHGEPHTDCTL
jgi:hypothetical protein